MLLLDKFLVLFYTCIYVRRISQNQMALVQDVRTDTIVAMSDKLDLLKLDILASCFFPMPPGSADFLVDSRTSLRRSIVSKASTDPNIRSDILDGNRFLIIFIRRRRTRTRTWLSLERFHGRLGMHFKVSCESFVTKLYVPNEALQANTWQSLMTAMSGLQISISRCCPRYLSPRIAFTASLS